MVSLNVWIVHIEMYVELYLKSLMFIIYIIKNRQKSIIGEKLEC